MRDLYCGVWRSVFGCLILLGTLVPVGLRAEDPPIAQWIARGGGTLTDNAGAVVVDAAGNVYFAGTFQTNATFGSTVLSAVDGGSLFLAKLNSAGAFQWAQFIESGVSAVTEPVRLQFDSAGKLLLVCTPAGDAGANPPLNQLLVGKYEPANGSTIWSRKIQSTVFADTIGRGMAQDGSGNIYIAGSFSGTTTFGSGISRTTSGGLDAFLLKLNSAGTTLAVHTFGQPGTVSLPDDQLFGVTLDNAGNIYAVGEFANTITVGTNTLTSAGDRDIVLIKYDSNLNVLWARRLGSTGADYGRALTHDSAGNIYMYAYAGSAYALGINFSPSGYVVSRLDGVGNPSWVSAFGNAGNTSDAYGLTMDSADNLLLCSGHVVGKFDKQGTLMWARQAFSDDARDLALLNNTNLFVATSAYGVFTLDNVTVTNLATDAMLVKLTIPPIVPPSITVQPTNKVVALNGNTSFAVGATGTSPISYQWRLYGTNLSGQITSTLSIFGAQPYQAGPYTVVVTNPGGVVTSQVATLTVTIPPPTITVQPYSVTVYASSNASFSVTATGTAPLTYQWRLYGTNVAGATTSTYNMPSVTGAMAGPYTALVSNPGGSVTSQVATLTVNYIPISNLVNPTNTTVFSGSNAVLYSGAYGSPPMTFQWQKNGTNFGPPGPAILQFTNVQVPDAGNYRVIVSNPVGSVTSSVAVLTVRALLNPGPALQWVKSGGGDGTDYGEGVATDASGNIYISGTTSGTFKFAGITTTNDTGPFVLKLDSSGNGLWLRRARGGSGQRAQTVVTTDGTNVFMAGWFAANTPLYFDNIAITPSTSGCTFLVKYGANGSLIWAKRVGVAEVPAVAADRLGGVYLAGAFTGTFPLGSITLTNTAATDVYLTQLDGNGNYLWAKNGRGKAAASRPNSIKVDAGGNVWLSGYFANSLDFGAAKPLTNTYSTTNPQCFVARFQPNGNLIWQVGTTNYGAIQFAALDIVDGTNAVVAGINSYGTVTWGSSDVTNNFWIGRLAGDGTMTNAAGGQINSPMSGFGLAVDPWGNAFIGNAQVANYTMTFGNSVIPAPRESSRAVLLRWNPDRTWEWGRTEGAGASNSVANVRFVAINSSGSPIAIGDWSGTNKVFGTTSVTNTGTGANAAANEIWVGKLASAAPVVPAISSTVIGNSLRLSWPAGTGNYVVETTSSLNLPFGSFAYMATTNAGTGMVEVNLPVSNTNAFFILRRL